MARTLTHLYAADLRVRDAGDDAAGGDGRTVIGLAVPFGVELEVSDWWDDYAEVFVKGCFAKTISDRKRPVPLLDHHDRRGMPIGVATALEERDAGEWGQAGLWAEFHLTPGVQKADEALALVKADAIGGLSIGFTPMQEKETKGPARTPPAALDLVERTEVMLREVSLCNFPAYEDAGVTGTRSRGGDRPSLADLAAERGRLETQRAVALDRWGRVDRLAHR
jgi:uncharacterized protein